MIANKKLSARVIGAARWALRFSDSEDRSRADAMDRLEGSVSQALTILSPSDRRNRADSELEDRWKLRQSRRAVAANEPQPPATGTA